MSYLRPLSAALTAFGALLVAIAIAGAAAGLVATMNARTRDLALLRALGAGPMRIASVALAEAMLIAGAALFVATILTTCVLYWGVDALAERTGLLLRPEITMDDVAYLVAGAFVTAVLAALFPALRAGHASIEELLQS
jgi:putative ABC transport system permease protein